MSPLLEIVTATRVAGSAFGATPLGESLARLAFDRRLHPVVFVNNTAGLSARYNTRIERADGAPYLLFVHDDVWLDDAFIVDRVIESLGTYDIVGVAGNRRVPPRHVSWAHADEMFNWDDPSQLTGALAHGDAANGPISYFGPSGPCALLDGVFLAARRDALLRTGVRFDARFDFHFYDLDFCRAASAAGLRLGTWPIAITHRSAGGVGNAAWAAALARYRDKWPPAPLSFGAAASDHASDVANR